MDTDQAMADSKKAIKEEVDKITAAVTRILLVGGPNFVEAVLKSLLGANDDIKSKLNLKSEVKFEEGK